MRLQAGGSAQLWVSPSWGGSALPLPCMDTRTPTLGPHRTQPFPTFPQHWLRQAPAPEASEVPGRCWSHSTKGEKSTPAPALLQELNLSLTQPIPTSKPSSEPPRMDPNLL